MMMHRCNTYLKKKEKKKKTQIKEHKEKGRSGGTYVVSMRAPWEGGGLRGASPQERQTHPGGAKSARPRA